MATGTAVEPIGQLVRGLRGGGFVGGEDGGSNYGPTATRLPERVYLTGLMAALCGIAMFFAALASAYVVREGLAQNDWRPFALPGILWLNTAILFASSAALGAARARQRRNDESGFRHRWFVAAALGVLFLAGQLIAWRQLARLGVYLATNPRAGFFYVFTVAHGVHLLAGLAVFLVLAIRGPRRMAHRTATRVIAVYWHFLTGLWFLLLLFLVFER